MTEQQVGHGRPQPEGSGRRGRRARTTSPDVRLRPLVAAGVVLVLWFAWLLVPSAPEDTAVEDTAVAGDAGERAPDGLSAQLFGDDGADRSRAAPGAVPSAVPVGPEAAPTGDGTASPAPVDPAPVDPAPVDPAPVDPAPVDPAPVVVPQAGEGTFAVAPGGTERVGSGGALVSYSVEVEDGVPVDAAEVAVVVDAVLADPRSWTAEGEWSLQRTDADPDVRIRVASPDTTDRLCAPLRTRGQLSCRNGDDVALNALRWTEGADAWGDDLAGYREYLVNHELGHYLGYGHVRCPVDGEPAPVMLQQTLGLQGCTPNGWPFP
ncbi:DUF3152 domain-containing protein [Aquipuribacter sp. MA13-6]|uniref:DUF3152 domain-containing protein n=1 Tax=Aquipuribacter sp. MA13-6 TaxID=3440839 RepID=UPI003F49168B